MLFDTSLFFFFFFLCIVPESTRHGNIYIFNRADCGVILTRPQPSSNLVISQIQPSRQNLLGRRFWKRPPVKPEDGSKLLQSQTRELSLLGEISRVEQKVAFGMLLNCVVTLLVGENQHRHKENMQTPH